jgi:hypothetical protein
MNSSLLVYSFEEVVLVRMMLIMVIVPIQTKITKLNQIGWSAQTKLIARVQIAMNQELVSFANQTLENVMILMRIKIILAQSIRIKVVILILIKMPIVTCTTIGY